jgi:hypothetical protein
MRYRNKGGLLHPGELIQTHTVPITGTDIHHCAETGQIMRCHHSGQFVCSLHTEIFTCHAQPQKVHCAHVFNSNMLIKIEFLIMETNYGKRQSSGGQ